MEGVEQAAVSSPQTDVARQVVFISAQTSNLPIRTVARQVLHQIAPNKAVYEGTTAIFRDYQNENVMLIDIVKSSFSMTTLVSLIRGEPIYVRSYYGETSNIIPEYVIIVSHTMQSPLDWPQSEKRQEVAQRLKTEFTKVYTLTDKEHFVEYNSFNDFEQRSNPVATHTIDATLAPPYPQAEPFKSKTKKEEADEIVHPSVFKRTALNLPKSRNSDDLSKRSVLLQLATLADSEMYITLQQYANKKIQKHIDLALVHITSSVLLGQAAFASSHWATTNTAHVFKERLAKLAPIGDSSIINSAITHLSELIFNKLCAAPSCQWQCNSDKLIEAADALVLAMHYACV
jgi:hypothetical protein